MLNIRIFYRSNSIFAIFKLLQSHSRPTCPARLIAWNGIVKKKSGEHLHESVKDKISCMLVEQMQLEKALENPTSANTKDLMTSISRKLMENENVILNNVGLMSSEKALGARLQRAKKKVLGKESISKVGQKMPKYFNVGQLVNSA